MGKVNVRGAYMMVPLTFRQGATICSSVIVESGVAIGSKDPQQGTTF